MLFPDNILLANFVNLNDESQLRFMLQVISLILCVLFLYNNLNANTENEKKKSFYASAEITGSSEKLNNYSLTQNSPNPFSDSTLITYSLAEKSKVLLEIYNDKAETIEILVNEVQESGSHSIFFHAEIDGLKLPAGVYYYRLKIIGDTKVNEFVDVKRMVIFD